MPINTSKLTVRSSKSQFPSPELKSLQAACCLRHWCASWNHPCRWWDWEGLWSWEADQLWTLSQPPALMIRPENTFSFLQMRNTHSCLRPKQKHKESCFTYILMEHRETLLGEMVMRLCLLVMGNLQKKVCLVTFWSNIWGIQFTSNLMKWAGLSGPGKIGLNDHFYILDIHCLFVFLPSLSLRLNVYKYSVLSFRLKLLSIPLLKSLIRTRLSCGTCYFSQRW